MSTKDLSNTLNIYDSRRNRRELSKIGPEKVLK